MINPSAVQILRTIETTLVDVVEPAVGSTTARSALATIGHLLRHVALRIEGEGQVLADDIARLETLLADVRAYLEGAGDSTQAAAVAAGLDRAAMPVDGYPTLAMMGARAAGLRQTLQDALVHLQAQRAARAADAGYAAARSAIRTYLGEQILAEATLIDPAFADHGPRR
ncbi:MAG: hypothetical protein RIS94_218 [Pseudomonadota bacterium]|jgi:hypothetical protein